MSIFVSVICATIGPLASVDTLIESLHASVLAAGGLIRCELILVDQSQSEHDHVFSSSEFITLVHIKNPVRGLSLNRNIGLRKATGDWIFMLDSDCTIDVDFFKCFSGLIQNHPEIDHFVGRILDTEHNRPLFRNWPDKPREISTLMTWYFATSVNNIYKTRKSGIRFDELFGLGAKYGSCEDIDFFLRMNSRKLYSPELIIRHPDFSHVDLPREKLNAYSFGFGALCAKHVFPLGGIMLLLSLIKKARDVVFGKTTPADLASSFIYRLNGFASYLVARILGNHG